jgi:hypothetical protein
MHLQVFKNSLCSILKEALTSWVAFQNGNENIRSWVGLSPDEVDAAVKSKEKPVGFYTTMLRHNASNLKNNTQFNKRQIMKNA